MNRLILKIQFINDKSLKMSLVFVDRRLLSEDGDFVYFQSYDIDFMIYSRNEMKMTDDTLRLPSLSNYEPNISSIFEFENENKMYNWLKKLYNTLNQCNDNFTPFIKDEYSHNRRLKKIKLDGEFWIL